MSRPPKKTYTLAEKIQKIKAAGIHLPAGECTPAGDEESLQERIKKVLHLLQTAPVKATSMPFLILYDIENDKVRNEVAKYLKKAGCIRIQKSVFICHADQKIFDKIGADLHEIQQYYENNDSMILVPFNTTDARSMKIVGKDIQISAIIDKPTTLFF